MLRSGLCAMNFPKWELFLAHLVDDPRYFVALSSNTASTSKLLRKFFVSICDLEE